MLFSRIGSFCNSFKKPITVEGNVPAKYIDFICHVALLGINFGGYGNAPNNTGEVVSVLPRSVNNAIGGIFSLAVKSKLPWDIVELASKFNQLDQDMTPFRAPLEMLKHGVQFGDLAILCLDTTYILGQEGCLAPLGLSKQNKKTFEHMNGMSYTIGVIVTAVLFAANWGSSSVKEKIATGACLITQITSFLPYLLSLTPLNQDTIDGVKWYGHRIRTITGIVNVVFSFEKTFGYKFI